MMPRTMILVFLIRRLNHSKSWSIFILHFLLQGDSRSQSPLLISVCWCSAICSSSVHSDNSPKPLCQRCSTYITLQIYITKRCAPRKSTSDFNVYSRKQFIKCSFTSAMHCLLVVFCCFSGGRGQQHVLNKIQSQHLWWFGGMWAPRAWATCTSVKATLMLKSTSRIESNICCQPDRIFFRDAPAFYSQSVSHCACCSGAAIYHLRLGKILPVTICLVISQTLDMSC